uniref:acid phosphatase n=1 Tax=Papilio xuthus TaxID=66420 RepID=I4DJY6_PAPXU|nr:lysosomal acid phosphatase-like precursor [Papilio xuthus]BAM18226.1 acid phosphatase [Papilio xuthus]
MLAVITFVFVFCTSNAYVVRHEPILLGTDLVLTFLVHRHGDRTPVPQYVNFSDQREQLKELTKPIGYGQLTDAGKRRAYELGNFIRARYGEFLSPQYNRSEIYLRSTDSTRAKMTILVEMAGAYSASNHGWSDDINWVPVPYTTMPLQYDFVMGMNCPKFMDHFDKIARSRVPEMQKHSSVIERLSSVLKIDLRNTPVQTYFAYDVFVSQINMGLPVTPSIKEMMPEIKMAADTAFDLLFGNQTMLPLQAGLLLKEFFEVSYATIAGEPSPKVRIYSGHDVNVYALEAISRVMPQGAPPYAALFALELRKVRKTGRYVVLPVYISSPGEPVQYLQVKGCDLLCDLDRFYEITSPDLIDIDDWKSRCNYDMNAKFNTNGFE